MVDGKEPTFTARRVEAARAEIAGPPRAVNLEPVEQPIDTANAHGVRAGDAEPREIKVRALGRLAVPTERGGRREAHEEIAVGRDRSRLRPGRAEVRLARQV
ncbi:MAG: hypothetical protein R3A48_04445 [Polyangiales bacterium]